MRVRYRASYIQKLGYVGHEPFLVGTIKSTDETHAYVEWLVLRDEKTGQNIHEEDNRYPLAWLEVY